MRTSISPFPGPVEEDDINVVGKYLYSWITPMFSRGWERSKNKEIMFDEDLLHLPASEEAHMASAQFKPAWEEELLQAEERRKAAPNVVAAAEIKPRLFRVLMTVFRRDVLISAFCRLVADGLTVAAPFFLRELITWLGYQVYAPQLTNMHTGFIWSVVLGINQFIISLFNNASLFHNQKAFCNMRTVVSLALYDKAIKMDAQHGITGLVQQMHGSDTYKFVELSLFFHQLWVAPCIIVAALISLYYFIGWAGVLSFGVILVVIPFQGVVAKTMMALRGACSGRADARINAINEIMHGIRIVKFMGWEKRFMERVEGIRDMEVALFHRLFKVRSVLVIVISYLPVVVSFFVFAVAYKGFDFDINPKSVFPAMAMLNVLRSPLAFLPLAIARMVDLFVGIDRIVKFLSRGDKQSTITFGEKSDVASSPDAVVMENVTVQYKVEETTTVEGVEVVSSRDVDLMSGINLRIARGKLTLIVGATGCGKSTMMNAMVGESQVTAESKVMVNGEIAFITQEAWIMNATLRDNILMGKEFDHDKYLASLNDCQLIADLQQLAAADQTEIGERGVNVSGGQKQRVAFARAVYSGRDIVLMDDPLSAVDAHVCVALFEDCILGALKDRTRVLVTHQVQFLPRADRIVVVDQCKIVFDGTYDELQRSTVDVVAIVASASPQTPSQAGKSKIVAELSPDDAVDDDVHYDEADEERPHEVKRTRASEIPTNALSADHGGEHLMTTEHQVQGGIGLGVIAWYLKIQNPVIVMLVVVTFFAWRGVSVVTDLLVSWWSARTKVLDRTLTQDQYLMWYGLFTLFSGALLVIRQFPFVAGMVNACKVSNKKMVYALLHAPTSFFDTTPTGRVISRFSKDMEQMDVAIPESLNFFYNLVLMILGAIGVMIYSAPYLAIAVGVLLIIFYFLYTFYTVTNRAQKRLEAANRSPMSSVMNETLGGLPTIRAYGMVENFVAKHVTKVELSNRSIYSWRNSQRWLSVRVDAISSCVVVATALITCGLMTSYGTQQQLDLLPVMSLAITYAINIGGAIGYLTTMTAELESAMSSVERVKEYCDELPQEKVVTYGSGPDCSPEPPAEWPKRGVVTFQNASLRYRDGLPLVLKNISLVVEGGHKVGIIGRTGSGKSTIMLALFRMVELAEGAIYFDGIDISRLTMEDLRSKITIIPQDPLLFQGTIRSNLDPFFESSDEEVWSVLEKVNMAERVRRDDQGLECNVAEKGANFSVGQRQLLCLARALLKKCKILLLDEATASVDFDADAMIQRTIRKEFAHCTVLTIAHRLATVIDSDRIVVLDHGVVREYDTPANLVRDENSQFNGMLRRLGDELYTDLKQKAIEAETASR